MGNSSEEWMCSLCCRVFYEGEPDRKASSEDREKFNSNEICDDCWGTLTRHEASVVTASMENGGKE